MRGLEVYHPGHPPKAVRRYKRMALEHDLLISGGSDCHGMAKGQPMIGHVRISKDQLEKIKGSRG